MHTLHADKARRALFEKMASLAGMGSVTKASSNAEPKPEPLLSSRLWRVALIGCGWYGQSDVFKLIQVANVEVLAVCDVDRRHREEAARLISQRQTSGKTPKTYNDYQEMLKAHKFDLAIIGTPDHWHALQCIDCLKAGLHVYLQKPISVDVREGDAILAAAKKYNKVIQVGLQRRFTPHLLNAKHEVLGAGLLGDIHHVDMWCYFHMRANRHPQEQDVPDFFDYEKWTGPAPMRPYDGLPHRMWWRAFTQYSNGIVGDMCVHMYDTVRWLLDLPWPTRISSHGGIFAQTQSKANTSDTQTAVFEHDKLNCVWQHRSWGRPPNPDYPWAFAIYGTKGTLIGSTMQADFIPEDDEQAAIHFDLVYEKEKYPMDLLEKDIEHNAAPPTRLLMLDFLHAIENKRSPLADIEQAHISTASCILANIAMELGRPLQYDPLNKVVKDDPEATALLARKYRAPYQHPVGK